jgi:hypothetical protein
MNATPSELLMRNFNEIFIELDPVLSRNSNVLRTMRVAGVGEMARDTVDEWAFSIRSASW